MRTAATASVGALLGLVWVLGCSDGRGMPEPAVCQGECGSGAEGVVGSSTGSGGSGGSSGASGASGASNASVELGGTVLRLNDVDFGSSAAEPFREVAIVTAEGAATASVTVDYDGFDPFLLPGVRRGEEVWTLVEPRNGTTDAMPTLQPLYTFDAPRSGALELDLALLRESVLAAAFSVVPNPVVVEPMRAQVVLLFLDGDDPIAGVRVGAPAAGRIIYAVGGTYSDAATETDETGLVLLANLPASDWPGTAAQINVSGTAVGSFATRIVSDAVTIAAYAR